MQILGQEVDTGYTEDCMTEILHVQWPLIERHTGGETLSTFVSVVRIFYMENTLNCKFIIKDPRKSST